MDGTLYKPKGGSFRNSGLLPLVFKNAAKYIADLKKISLEEGQKELNKIFKKYNEEISIAIEEEYGGNRYDYFNTVWDIPAKDFIEPNEGLKEILEKLKENYLLVVVSDAPTIWTTNVLKELGVYELFEDNIFTGEGDDRKIFGNGFQRVLDKLGVKAEDAVSIGDQEHTDILPAKNLGMTTIFIGSDVCASADYSINDISEVIKILGNDYELILREYLTKNKFKIKEIKQLSGSSEAKAFLCDEQIYKVGPSKVIHDEVKSFDKFKQKMKSYNSVFPEMEVRQDDESVAILWIENCGKNNIEDLYLESLQNADILEKLNKNVLAKINLLFEETKINDNGELFFAELLEAFKINLVKAGLVEKFSDKLQIIEEKKYKILEKFVASFAHKDLSVGNIIVSNDREYVRFIDPRSAVPYLEDSKASGNVIIDLIGYQVSLYRKEMEAKQNKQDLDFSKINLEIEQAISEYQAQGIFTEELKMLCLAVWYSVYAACKCDYCTAPERLWLYNEMVRRLKKVLMEI